MSFEQEAMRTVTKPDGNSASTFRDELHNDMRLSLAAGRPGGAPEISHPAPAPVFHPAPSSGGGGFHGGDSGHHGGGSGGGGGFHGGDSGRHSGGSGGGGGFHGGDSGHHGGAHQGSDGRHGGGRAHGGDSSQHGGNHKPGHEGGGGKGHVPGEVGRHGHHGDNLTPYEQFMRKCVRREELVFGLAPWEAKKVCNDKWRHMDLNLP